MSTVQTPPIYVQPDLIQVAPLEVYLKLKEEAQQLRNERLNLWKSVDAAMIDANLNTFSPHLYQSILNLIQPPTIEESKEPTLLSSKVPPTEDLFSILNPAINPKFSIATFKHPIPQHHVSFISEGWAFMGGAVESQNVGEWANDKELEKMREALRSGHEVLQVFLDAGPRWYAWYSRSKPVEEILNARRPPKDCSQFVNHQTNERMSQDIEFRNPLRKDNDGWLLISKVSTEGVTSMDRLRVITQKEMKQVQDYLYADYSVEFVVYRDGIRWYAKPVRGLSADIINNSINLYGNSK